MLEQSDQEFISRIKVALNKTDKIIALYKSELKEGRFRPRNGSTGRGQLRSRWLKLRL